MDKNDALRFVRDFQKMDYPETQRTLSSPKVFNVNDRLANQRCPRSMASGSDDKDRHHTAHDIVRYQLPS